jgi:hypothetical protein
MGQRYLERPVAGTAADGGQKRGPQDNEHCADAMSHADHQDRTLDSGDTGVLLKHDGQRTAGCTGGLVPTQVPKFGWDRRASERSRPEGVGEVQPRTMRRYWAESTWVNTVPGLRGPLDLQIESRGGGSTPSCSRMTVA